MTKQQPKIQYSSGNFLNVEEVEKDSQIGFAAYDSGSNIWNFKLSLPNIKPVPKEDIPWFLPAYPEDYGSEPELYKEVRSFIYDHVDLPNDWQYDVLTAYVFAQYLPEYWESVPYLNFIGPKGCGKTRAEKTLHLLSYRGIFGTSISTSAMFHAIHKDHASIFYDEAEILADSKEKGDLMAIINNGYQKDGRAYRYNMDLGHYEHFNTFGFKVFTSTKILAGTVEDRSIVFYMQKNVRDIPITIDRKSALKLRGKLLLFRFKHITQSAEESEASEATEAILKSKANDNRNVELYLPLYYILQKILSSSSKRASEASEVSEASPIDKILTALKNQTEAKQTEDRLSIEADIVTAITSCKALVINDRLSINDITTEINANREEKNQWKNYSISKQCKKLGFQSCRMTDGKAGIYWNEGLIKNLEARYGSFELKAESGSQAASTSQQLESW